MDFASLKIPAETDMRIHYVQKMFTVHQKNVCSDIQNHAKTTKEKEHVGSKIYVHINMRKIKTNTSVLKNLSQIMNKESVQLKMK